MNFNKEKMNTKRYIGLMSALLVALTPISCQKDLLDIKPIDFVSDAAVFQDITLTSQFVNDIYGTLLSGFERRDFGFDQDWAAGFALLDMMTDDLERSEEHTSELQSRENLVCRLLLEKKN